MSSPSTPARKPSTLVTSSAAWWTVFTSLAGALVFMLGAWN
ncbi:hypothetical protein ACH3WN_20110 [Streptomyces albogriseolus]